MLLSCVSLIPPHIAGHFVKDIIRSCGRIKEFGSFNVWTRTREQHTGKANESLMVMRIDACICIVNFNMTVIKSGPSSLNFHKTDKTIWKWVAIEFSHQNSVHLSEINSLFQLWNLFVVHIWQLPPYFGTRAFRKLSFGGLTGWQPGSRFVLSYLCCLSKERSVHLFLSYISLADNL